MTALRPGAPSTEAPDGGALAAWLGGRAPVGDAGRFGAPGGQGPAPSAAAVRAAGADPRFAELCAVVPLAEAVRADAAGVPLLDVDLHTFRDAALDPRHPPRVFGEPVPDAPVLLSYLGGERRVFLPTLRAPAELPRAVVEAGIDPARPRFGNRDLVAARVARALGTAVVPTPTFAVHAGRVGLLVPLAEGEEARVVGPRLRNLSAGALASLLERVDELEWADLLAGQIDRDGAGVVVRFSGDVAHLTALDNHLCFPARAREGGPWCSPTPARDVELVGARLARRIRELDFERELVPCMTGRLAAAEIDAAAARCFAAKKRVAELAELGCVVESWARWSKVVDGVRLGAAAYLVALGRRRGRTPSLFLRAFAPVLREGGRG